MQYQIQGLVPQELDAVYVQVVVVIVGDQHCVWLQEFLKRAGGWHVPAGGVDCGSEDFAKPVIPASLADLTVHRKGVEATKKRIKTLTLTVEQLGQCSNFVSLCFEVGTFPDASWRADTLATTVPDAAEMY